MCIDSIFYCYSSFQAILFYMLSIGLSIAIVLSSHWLAGFSVVINTPGTVAVCVPYTPVGRIWASEADRSATNRGPSEHWGGTESPDHDSGPDRLRGGV